MLFSAIIPVYNGAKYIKGLAADLQTQTCKDFEAIFINDGSTDDTLAILREVQENANFAMKIIDQENKGVSAARNAGIKAATGEYIIPIDVDDNIVNDFFATYKAAVNYCIADFYYAIVPPKHAAHKKSVYMEIKRYDALRGYLYHEIIINSLCYSSSFISKHSICYPEGFKYCEDLHFVWQILANSAQNIQIEKQIFYYNNTPQSAMKKFNEERIHAVTLMQQLEPFFKQKCPDFYPIYKRYAVARICWSLLWQAASFCPYENYKRFDRKFELTPQLKKLIFSFQEPKVSVSSAVAVLCPPLFYYVARKMGKKRIFQA